MQNKLLLLLFFSLAAITVNAQFSYLPKSNSHCQIVKRTHYSLSYNEEWEQAEWVAYELSPQSISGNAKRPSGFKSDPLVESGSASSKDYLKSGFDRGHLLPAAGMKMDQSAMNETFFMSNISPQAPYFNRGIWKKLESKVRAWVSKNQKLYVVTGPIVNKPYRTIGASKVAIPQKFYKVIYNPKIKQGIAFILSNEKSAGELKSFATTIDAAEKITNIDFFPALPDELERRVENSINLNNWF